MNWYAELTRTGRGAWHLIRDRLSGEPQGPSATTMPTRLTGVPSWATGSIPNTGAGDERGAATLAPAHLPHHRPAPAAAGSGGGAQPPSACLLERAGFHYEGTARECERKGMASSPRATTPSLRSDLPASL